MVGRILLFTLFVCSILLCVQLPIVMFVAALDTIWDWGLPNMEKWARTSLFTGVFGFICCFLIAPIWAHCEEYW